MHIGKRVNEISMLDEQKHILRRIIEIIDSEKPDAVLIAGDIYDKSVPPVEAVGLLDSFLVRLSRRDCEVFIISGNHDSPERLAFASQLIEGSGIHISPVYNGEVFCRTVKGVNIWLLPYVKPSQVRRFFEDEKPMSCTEAMRVIVSSMNIAPGQRNILVTHQLVTGAQRSDSEDISVGGADNIDASVFEPFDYVALGHIHRPQNCGSAKIRYCGTPLKYSFSEASNQKSVTVGELDGEKKLTLRTVGLTPLHDMVELKGSYEELTSKAFYDGTSYRDDYVHITLTDEDDIPDAVMKLRVIYRNLMKLDYDNARTRAGVSVSGTGDAERKTPLELFGDFFAERNNSELREEQRDYLQSLIESVWEE